MAVLSKNAKAQISTNVNEYFINPNLDRVDAHLALIKSILMVLNSKDLNTNENRLRANRQIKQIIENKYAFTLRQKLREEFTSFFYASEAALSKVPLVQFETQTDAHFKKQQGDKFPILIGKGVKRFVQNIDWLALHSANAFRKNKKEKKYWNRAIPKRQVARYFLEVRLFGNLLDLIKNTENQILRLLDAADTVTRTLTIQAAHPVESNNASSSVGDLKDIYESFTRLKEDFAKDSKAIMQQEFTLLDIALKKAGTIELNGSFFGKSLNDTRIEKIEKKYSVWRKRVERNHRIVKDNWILCHELNVFYEALRFGSRKVCDRLNSKVQRHIYLQIDQVKSFLQESNKAFETLFTDKELLKTAVLTERSRINGSFKKELIPRAVQMMLFQNIPTVTIALDKDFEIALKNLNTLTLVKKDFKVDEVLREAELSEINPRDLVSFEYFDGLKAAKNELHHELVKLNNKLQPALIEISNIHAYTFETAINNIEEQNASIKDIGNTIAQGFERTFEKIETLKAELEKIEKGATENLDAALQNLATDLQYLNSTDNAFELNVKLLEKKAKEKTRSYWLTISEFFKRHFKFLSVKSTRLYKYVVGLYKKTESSLIQDEVSNIDSELANFLSTVTNSFDKLPFIYRLLFRLEPLEDYNFYVDRDKALKALNTAYENWENGQFSNILITGPKGSGLTSVFNKFSFDLSDDIQVNRIYPRHNISDKEELIELLKSAFNQSKFEDVEDVGKYLAECGIKRVVLIDEFQRFFLRKVKGFEVVNELQKLMRITHNQVFWVVNLAEISSFYLFKTIYLNEFFSGHIQLRALNLEEIKELIMKRHLVSGYQLIFSDEISSNKKKLQKLSGIAKQEYLSYSYFEQLTKSSEGSLSLALLQWVMSVEVKDKQTIMVSPLTPVRNILKGLDSTKVSILHALLLHDGLNIKELTQVINFDVGLIRTHLASLEKNGVIENNKDFININPLLHWSTVNMLSKRNLIH